MLAGSMSGAKTYKTYNDEIYLSKISDYSKNISCFLVAVETFLETGKASAAI